MGERVRTAVFPVAGLGTRFLPATKAIPKEMLPIVDKPLIQYAVEEAAAAGITRFVFVTGRGKTAIEDHFDDCPELVDVLEARGKSEALEAVRACTRTDGEIAFTRQGRARGLGHAVWCAREIVGDEPFAVLLPDDLVLGARPCTEQLVDVHAGSGEAVLAVMEVPAEHVSRYGILRPGRVDGARVEARGLVEKPAPEAAPSTLAVIGRYVLPPEVFRHLDQAEPGAGGEIQLTDAITALAGRPGVVGYRFEGERFDCGDKLGFLEATLVAALGREDLGDDLRALLRKYV